MKESQIQKQITTYLQYLENAGKLYFERTNTFAGQIRRRDGSIGYMRNSKRGASDIKLYLPGGETVFIEVKAEKGRQSPDQQAFENKVVSLGFRYCIVKSVEDVRMIVNEYDKIGGTTNEI